MWLFDIFQLTHLQNQPIWEILFHESFCTSTYATVLFSFYIVALQLFCLIYHNPSSFIAPRMSAQGAVAQPVPGHEPGNGGCSLWIRQVKYHYLRTLSFPRHVLSSSYLILHSHSLVFHQYVSSLSLDVFPMSFLCPWYTHVYAPISFFLWDL